MNRCGSLLAESARVTCVGQGPHHVPAIGDGPDGPRALWAQVPLLLMGAVLLVMGVRTTHDLEWPSDPDLYRDIAQAQTIADGSLFSDPYYRGEKIWHNPLMPLIVAAVSKPLGLPVHMTYVRIGAYFNLLALIAFYVWVYRLAGVTGAAAATFGFVFYRETWAPNWVTAVYSPWLFAMTSSQSLMYGSLVAYRAALRRGGVSRHMVAGLLTGLTFLAAAPPALMLAGVLTAGAVGSVIRAHRKSGPAVRRALTSHLLLAAMALAVASPFLYFILWHYDFQVLNSEPMLWEWASLETVLPARDLRWPRLLAIAGAMVLALRARRRPLDALLLAAFVVTAAGLLAYRHLLALLGIHLPQFVPSHYFVFYLQAAQWMLVGVLVSNAWCALEALAGRLSGRRLASPARAAVIASALVAIGLVAVVPQYGRRGYFNPARSGSLEEAQRSHPNEAFTWIRRHTSPYDVFLAPEGMVLRVVGPAGRKTVVVSSVFSNPYVDRERRVRAAERIYRALLDRDWKRFQDAARQVGVTYLLSSRAEQEWLDHLLESDPPPGLMPSFESGGLKIWRLP